MPNSTDRAMNVRTPLGCCRPFGGVWGIQIYSDAWGLYHVPAAETCYVSMPLITVLNPQAGKGARLESVDVYWYLAAQDLVNLTAFLVQLVLPEQDGLPVRNYIGFSYDSGNDTAAERRLVKVHKMTLTLDHPAYPVSNDEWYVQFWIEFAATTDFAVYGMVGNYVIRD